MSTKVVKTVKKKATKKAASSTVSKSTPVKITLTDAIIESIQDKKGEQIVMLDLREITDSVADYFIVCEADNTTQVKAIAQHVAENTRDLCNEKPWHVEGMQNMEWVLIDYVNVVVHVFLKRVRGFYQIEELWNDAGLTEIA